MDAQAPNRWLAEAADRSRTYDRRWEEAAAAGQNIHGEADFVEQLGPERPSERGGGPERPSERGGGPERPSERGGGPERPSERGGGPERPSERSGGPESVLDAGCGTGRVAIELARRGLDVVGVDVDASMLERARAKDPGLTWVHSDLAGVDLGRTFDVVVMAGNVMIFLAPGTEAKVVANLTRHLAPAGALVAGFSLEPGRLDLATYDAHAGAAGLVLVERWATWDRQPFAGGDYAVSVHRRPGGA